MFPSPLRGLLPWRLSLPSSLSSREILTMTHRARTPAPRSVTLALLLGCLGLLLAACGGGEDETAEPRAAEDGVLRVVGQDDLRWDVEALTAPAGEVTFELICEDAVNHNIVIDELDEEVAECAPGETVTGSIELDPGTYTYVCTIPGHEATMRGELVVE